MSLSNEQVMAFIRKNPVGIGCGVLSLALAAAIYFRADLIPAARTELDQKAAESERLATNLKYAKELPEQFNQLSEDSKAIDSRLVSAQQIVTNQQYFYNLEAVTGTKISLLNQNTSVAQAKTAKTTYAPIAFSLNVQGTYPQLLDFLSRLESGLHFCRVLNTNCNKSGSADTPDLIGLNLTLELLGQP